jgi:hypothetical protein
MPLFIVFLIAPIAVAIALYRRNPRRFLDGPTEDPPLRLLPGLLGGLFAILVGLALSGFTAADQVTSIPTGWQRGVTVFAVPAVIGAAGTLWRRDPATGRRVSRLAAFSAGLMQLLYATVAVAILGGGGPPDADGGFTLRGTVSDRLGNNIVHLAVTTLFIAMVGWAAAALTGYLVSRTPLATDPVQEA